jgi:signal transduction histidine kinase
MEEQIEKIKLYLLVKAVALGVLFLAINLEFTLTAVSVIAYASSLAALAVAAVAGLAVWGLLKQRRSEPIWVHCSLLADLLAIFLGLYFGGGAQNTWGFLPLVVIVLGGYIFDLLAAAAYGLASFAGILALFGLDYWGVIPHQLAFSVPYAFWNNSNYLTDYLFGLFLIFALAALISGYINRASRRSAEHMKEVLAVTVAAREASENSRKSLMNVMEDLTKARFELEQRVRDRTRELEDIKNNLEKSVEERTKDLEAARRATLHMLKDLKDDMGKLEIVDRMKTEFLSMVSHELRTPLTPIKGYLSLLLSNKMGELLPAQRDALGILERQSDHLQDLIESLLDISRLELGKPIPIVKVPLSLKQVMDDVVEAVKIMAESRGLVLRLELADNLPTIVADEIKLKRVITNLVGNSIKFTPKGGAIVIRAFAEAANVRIETSDNGIGIPQDLLEKIFEKFFQIDSTYTRAAGGIGMGLAIARELVELHGGKIWAESAGAGKGAKFVVLLPIGGEAPNG